MTGQEMIQLGMQTQALGIDKLTEIRGIVEQGNELADTINMELDKQIEQLDRI